MAITPEALIGYSEGALEVNLEREWQRQAQELAPPFAPILKISEEDYIDTLPPFPEQPPFDEKLGPIFPLIVDRRVPWLKQIESAKMGISNDLNPLGIRVREMEGFQIPTDRPCTTWAQARYVDRNPLEVLQELSEAERWGTHLDGAALAILRSDIVRMIYFNLIGSQVGDDYIVGLGWAGRPRFNRVKANFARRGFCSLVCTKGIRIGKKLEEIRI